MQAKSTDNNYSLMIDIISGLVQNHLENKEKEEEKQCSTQHK